MKIFIKGLNTCTQRNQKLRQYKTFLLGNKHELVGSPEEADTILLWSCAFRGDVRDNSLVQIKKYKDRARKGSCKNSCKGSCQKKKAEVVVAGCLPDISPSILSEQFEGTVVPWKDDHIFMEKLFRVEGGISLKEAESILIKAPVCRDAAQYRAEHPDADVTFHDQFIQLVISEGCPFKCTYCSERLAFPDFRSFSAKDLIESCRKMIAETGRYEVVLIADCLGEFGRDGGPDICELMQGILDIDPKVKLALNNMHPANFIAHLEPMLEFVKQGRVHHLNLPVQSGSDKILKLMNRTYTKADITRLFGTLRDNGFREFDTHCLIGFPGETEQDFEETMDLMIKYRPKYVLLSRFLECDDAPAAKLGDKVAPDVALRRAQDAERRFKAAGIICNSDVGDVMKERFERINHSCGESYC